MDRRDAGGFGDLKKKLTKPPAFAFTCFDSPHVVETDASSVFFGAVLPQKEEN